MKYRFSIFILLISCFTISCQKPENEVALPPPNIETVSVYSVSASNAEVNIDISNVNSAIEEVGIVWSESPNPTIADKKNVIGKVSQEQYFQITINDLALGRSYYVRAYFLNNNEVIYSNSINFKHNFTNEWVKAISIKLEKNQYVLPENAFFDREIGAIKVDKANKELGTTKTAYYFPDNFMWDPPFLNIPIYAQDHVNFMQGQTRFNQILLDFDIGQNLTAKIIGAGHYQTPKEVRYYHKDLIFYGPINGYKWEPFYRGADANTTSVKVGRNGYVLENLPKGKLWRLNYDFGFKWDIVSEFPYSKKAKTLAVASNGNAYFIVEPDDLNENSLIEVFEYNPTKNQWTKKANFVGENRRKGVIFTIKNRVFYGTGQSVKTSAGLRDIWEYNPQNDTWKKTADYPGGGTMNLLAVEYLNNSIYLGFGNLIIPNPINSETIKDMPDFWRFIPKE
jgi:hypothetical protein